MVYKLYKPMSVYSENNLNPLPVNECLFSGIFHQNLSGIGILFRK